MSTELLEPEAEEITDEAHLAQVMQAAREAITRRTLVLDLCEGLLRKLPRELREKAHIAEDWLIFYQCDHEDALGVMRHLGLGRWERKLNHDDQSRVDYSARHEGFLIQIWNAPPPASCRIVEEEVEVPAQTITKRRLVCAPQ